MKTIITFFLVSLMSLSLHAQITIGLTGGVNFSSAKFKDNHRAIQEGYIGLHAGVSGKYQITDVVYFSLEGQFTEKGYNPEGKSRFSGFDQPFPIGFKETVYKKRYLDIMPEVEVRLIDWASIGLGAQYGYYLESLRKSEGEDWVKQVTYQKVNDVGLIASLRFYYKKFFTTLRYNYGLQDVEPADSIDLDGTRKDQKEYTRNFQIGMGYNIIPFKVKKKSKGPWY